MPYLHDQQIIADVECILSMRMRAQAPPIAKAPAADSSRETFELSAPRAAPLPLQGIGRHGPAVPMHVGATFQPRSGPVLPASAADQMGAWLKLRARAPIEAARAAADSAWSDPTAEAQEEAEQTTPRAPRPEAISPRAAARAPEPGAERGKDDDGQPPEEEGATIQLARAEKGPLEPAARVRGAPLAVSMMAAHLQLRARDPMAATGLLPGGRVTPLPGEKAATTEPQPAEGASPEAQEEQGTEEAHETHEARETQEVREALPALPVHEGERAPVQMACASDCECAKCSAARDGMLDEIGLQRDAKPGAGPPTVDAGEVRSRLGSGSPLPAPVAEKFSHAYGRDMSSVRIHVAHALPDQIGARAFTVGRDVAFAPGEYRPGTPEGDRLIGHELAHVVQQAGGESTVQGEGLSESDYEHEADHAADKAIAGHRVHRFTQVGSRAVQREEKGTLGRIADFAKQGMLAGIRLLSPTLADFLEDPLGYLEAHILPRLQAWVSGLFGVDLGELAGEARTALGELTSTISGAIAGDEKSCLAFASAVQKVRDLYDRLKNSAVIKKIASALSTIQRAFDKVASFVLTPAFDLLRTIAGGVWDVVTKVAANVGAMIDFVKAKISGAIDWISKKLGFSDGPGLLEFLRAKARQLWEKVQKTIAPVATPLKILIGLFLLMMPPTWSYLIFKYGPDVIAAAKWLWAHRSDPNIIASAKEGGHPMLAKILSTVQSIGGAIKGAAAKAGSALEAGVTAALNLAGAVTGLPVLGAVEGAAQSLGRGLRSLASAIGSMLSKGAAWVSGVASTVAEKIAPIQGVLTKLTLALMNPSQIPVMLTGWAWTKLPDCYKGPIIDLILDALIGILEASPSNPVFGPLWALLKPGIVGFVRQLRKMSTPVKVEASNKIATFMSAGSPQFLLGYAKGLLVGIWDNTGGTVGDIIELGHALVEMAEGAVVSAVDAAMGTNVATATKEKKQAPAPPAPPASPPPKEATAAAPTKEPAAAAPAHHEATAAPAPQGEPKPPAPKEPALDEGGVTQEEISREALDQFRPKDEEGEESAHKAPRVSAEQFEAEKKILAQDLKPSAATIANDAGGALEEYFKSGSNMTYGELAAKLGKAWGAAQNLISGQGAKLAREATAVLLGKDGDFAVGEKVGWLAGMIVVEVVIDIFTGGGGTAAKGAAKGAKAAKAAATPAKWTTRALDTITAAFTQAKSLLEAAANGLREMVQQIKGAMKRVAEAIREAGKSIGAFVDRLLGKASHAHMPPGATREARAAAHEATTVAREGRAAHELSAAEREAALAREARAAEEARVARGPHEPAGAKPKETPKEPHGEAGTRAERDASVKKSGQVESSELTQHQIDQELQHISDNPHLIQGEPPNRTAQIGEHKWIEKDGKWCRHSNTTVCNLTGPPGIIAPPRRLEDLRNEMAPLRDAERRGTLTEADRERLEQLRSEMNAHHQVPAGESLAQTEARLFGQQPGESLQAYRKRLGEMADEVEQAATSAGNPLVHERYQQIVGEVDEGLTRAKQLREDLKAAKRRRAVADAQHQAGRRAMHGQGPAPRGSGGSKAELDRLDAEVSRIEDALKQVENRGTAARSAAYSPDQMGRVAPCFAPGTLVHTVTGALPIETLVSGDLVLAWDPAARRAVPRRVLAVHRGVTDFLVDVRAGGEVIVATRAHPFWVEEERAFRGAATLRAGDVLRGLTQPITVDAAVTRPEISPTVNLEVEELHCYFVGANGVLVHNGPPEGPSLRSYRNPDRRWTEIYLVEERIGPGQYRKVYVGKTYKGVQSRFASGHLTEIDDPRKARWIELAEETERLRLTDPHVEPRIRSTPIADGVWNNAETAVWEKHGIIEHGGFERTGGTLVNKANPIDPDTFKELKKSGLLDRVCP